MKKNMGEIDKSIRLIIAAIVVVLYFMNIIQGTFGIVLLAFAGIIALTSLVSFCPLYKLLGFSSGNSEETRDSK